MAALLYPLVRFFRPVPKVSLATAADGPALADLYRRAWGQYAGRLDPRVLADQAPGAEEVAAWFRGGFEVYRATQDGRLVGAVRCSFPTSTCLVDRLVVDPEHARKGFGRVLAEHAVSRARRAGVTRVWVYLSPKLDDARQLFETLGFTESGDVPAPYWGEPVVLLELAL